MAAKQPTLSYSDIVKGAAKGRFAPMYILMGEEEYFIDTITETIERNALAEEDRDFNSFIFYGADVQEIEDVAMSARQFPVMAERRLVILKEAQAMQSAKSQLDKLAAYAAKPTPTTVFVIAFKGEPLSATSKLIKAATAGGAVIFRSDRVRENNLLMPIKNYCEEKNLTIDEKAVSMLGDFLGTSLKKLFSEIDKLIVAEGKNLTRITPETVEKNIGISKDFNNFELTSAIAMKDYVKAIRIINYFSRNPTKNSGIASSALIFSFFVKLMIANSLADRSDQSIMAALKAKSVYSLRDVKLGMRYYNFRQTMAAIHFIREFDAKAKGINSAQKEHELMKEMVFNIISY